MTLGPQDRLDIDPLVDDPATRIVVCCGSGGVGKTTTAAALGLRAAERGRKAVVLTIDPARRLAQSMGLSELDNTPRRVPDADTSAGGGLHAMMLDMKRTFDEIVEAHADPERAQAILNNPFYQSLSAGFAGTQEYMAMEKLGQLHAAGTSPQAAADGAEWDLIVVDTPPSRSALDFLDAPERLGSFLDGRFIRMLMAPAKVGGKAGMKFVNLGMSGLSVFTGALNKLLGAGLLRDVQTFVAAMDTMFGGFRTRADATYRLLQAPGTAFVVVAAPERDALREAAYFVERLAADRMPLAGLVLNRVHGSGATRLSAERALAAAENLEEAEIPPGVGHTGIVDLQPGKVQQHDGPEGSAATPEGDSPRPSGPGAAGRPAGAHPAGDRSAHTRSAPTPGSDGAPDTDRTSEEHSEHDAPGGDGLDEDTAGPALTGAAHAQPGSAQPAPAQGQSGSEPPPGGPSQTDGDGTGAEQLAAGLLRLHAERMQLLARERRTLDRFVALHPQVPLAEVPALPSDVHDLAGLRAIGDSLAAAPTGQAADAEHTADG